MGSPCLCSRYVARMRCHQRVKPAKSRQIAANDMRIRVRRIRQDERTAVISRAIGSSKGVRGGVPSPDDRSFPRMSKMQMHRHAMPKQSMTLRQCVARGPSEGGGHFEPQHEGILILAGAARIMHELQ